MVVKNSSTSVRCVFLTIALSLASNIQGQAYANPIGSPPGRAYAKQAVLQSISNDITGAKGTFQSGTNDLSVVPLSGTTSSAAFIIKDVWLITSEVQLPNQPIQPGCWIEAQVTKSSFSSASSYPQLGLTGNSYSGYWIASMRALNATTLGYKDFPYGVNNSTTAANGGTVEIARGLNSAEWNVKINGVVALTLSSYACAKSVGGVSQVYFPSGGSQVYVGIESNDNSPLQTFVNNTKIVSIQTKKGGGAYFTPLAGDVINKDSNTFGWSSSYSNGQVIFKR